MISWSKIKNIIPVLADKAVEVDIVRDKSKKYEKNITSKSHVHNISNFKNQKSPTNPKSVKQL